MTSLRTAVPRVLQSRRISTAPTSIHSCCAFHPSRRLVLLRHQRSASISSQRSCIPTQSQSPSQSQSQSRSLSRPFSSTTLFAEQSQSQSSTTTTTTTTSANKDGNGNENGQGETSTIPPSKIYTFEEIQSLSEALQSQSEQRTTTPSKLIIDVREPSEVLGTGKIPGSRNVPISSAPDSFFLSGEEFEDRFGFARPTAQQEVVFYCKAGVRSKAAARLAGQAGFGGSVGEFPGSWVEWFGKGGMVEREE